MSRIATLSRCASRIWFRLAIGCLVPVVVLSAPRARAAGDAPEKSTEKKPPDPEVVELETNDGLQMEATYYGSIKGKDAVPIIMLHGWKGSSADFAPLAFAMQQAGHAVIVPDLRGHGKSTRIKMGNDERSIDQGQMKIPDFDAMVTQDMVAVEKFLLEKNNNAELNIEKLCVIGADMGSVIGMEWTVKDWKARQLLTGKQGQDVKALVLISPTVNFRGVNANPAIEYVTHRPEVSVLVMVGGDKGDKGIKALEEAQRIFNRFPALRRNAPTDAKEAEKNQDLFFDNLKTSLQGTKILEDKKLQAKVSADIGQFIELRLVNKKYPWAQRKPGLGD